MVGQLPKIPVLHSMKVEVKAGEIYYWCACGFSPAQPFCDGAHCAEGFTPVRYTAVVDGVVSFCGCKHTLNPPLCDGSHKALREQGVVVHE